MKISLDLEKLDNRLENKRWPLLIAGPCSAETETQLMDTAKELKKIGKVSAFRAGIWKPRTRPGSFEGVGEIGLKWMQNVKAETGFSLATEVADVKHVEACLKHDIDILWIGARSSANPFSVQNIADALKGTDVTVMIKNPVNPDLQLWIGALERLNRAGIKKLAAIHRGFSAFRKMVFRNDPGWSIPIELKTMIPELPIICDPSHITGSRDLIAFMSQKSLDMNMNGLMIESHISPDHALSDAAQQVTPRQLDQIITDLIIRDPNSNNIDFHSQLDKLRNEIDQYDEEIFQKLSARMKVAEKIGHYKKENDVTIFQMGRWEQILEGRVALGAAMGLSEQFMKIVLQAIHQESIRVQTEIMND